MYWDMSSTRYAVLLLNGVTPCREIFRRYIPHADGIVAADGAARHVSDYSLTPIAVVGDGDSIKTDDRRAYASVLHIDDNQETTDAEKGLIFLKQRGYGNIVLIGGTGRRLDHTLHLLNLMVRYADMGRIVLIEDYYVAFRLPPVWEEDLPVDTSLSLMPFPYEAKGIVTRGLKYPLKDETLRADRRDGISNIVTERPIRVSYREGHLFAFVNFPLPGTATW